VVDRLLASPHYGERWARPWLEMARYGDSNGFGTDPEEQQWLSSVDRVNTTATVWLGTLGPCELPGSERDSGCVHVLSNAHSATTISSTPSLKRTTAGSWPSLTLPGMTSGPRAKERYWQHEPDLLHPTPEQAARRKELEAGIARLKAVLDTQTPELASAQALWETEMKGASTQWTPS